MRGGAGKSQPALTAIPRLSPASFFCPKISPAEHAPGGRKKSLAPQARNLETLL
jgi:hypothetical protein